MARLRGKPLCLARILVAMLVVLTATSLLILVLVTESKTFPHQPNYLPTEKPLLPVPGYFPPPPQIQISCKGGEAVGGYGGPLVRGWGPCKDRRVARYTRPEEDTVLTGLSFLELANATTLIIVQSAPKNADRRSSSRQTWMKDLEKFPEIKVIFLFGTGGDGEDAGAKMEARLHRDILQMDYVDAYENVTLDSVSALKFVNSFPFKNNLDFVLLGDDDTYINIPVLWSILYEKKIISRESSYLLGKLFITPQVLRWKEEDIKKDGRIVPRSVSPEYMYSGEKYPDFMSGSLYVVPIGVLACLYSACLRLPFFHINDVFVTGFAAEACGVGRVGHEGFHAGLVEAKDFHRDLVSAHYSTATNKALLHHIASVQEGVLEVRGASRYYLLRNNSLAWCDEKGECSRVVEQS